MGRLPCTAMQHRWGARGLPQADQVAPSRVSCRVRCSWAERQGGDSGTHLWVVPHNVFCHLAAIAAVDDAKHANLGASLWRREAQV